MDLNVNAKLFYLRNILFCNYKQNIPNINMLLKELQHIYNITGGSVDVGADQRDQECDGEQQSSCGRRLGRTRQSPHDSSSRVSLLSSNSLNPASTADFPRLTFLAPRILRDTNFFAVFYVCVC